MTPAPVATTSEIVTAFLGGNSAAQLSVYTGSLSPQEHRTLCCTLCCMRNEVAANCQERADEIDRFLEGTGAGSPPVHCKIYAESGGWCPLLGDAPLELPATASAAT